MLVPLLEEGLPELAVQVTERLLGQLRQAQCAML
jgi:hypothetical protein